MIADLGAGKRPALYDLCSKYRSGVYIFYKKSRGGKCPSRRVIKVVSLTCFRSGNKKTALLNVRRNMVQGHAPAGAANRAWTGDLVLTKDVLYLLSHSSKPITVIYYTLSLPLCQALFSTFLLCFTLSPHRLRHQPERSGRNHHMCP